MPAHVRKRVEDEFVRSEGELAVTACLLVEGSGDALLELAVGVGAVSSVESEVIKVDHEFKVFRHVVLGPVFDAVLGLQVTEADLVNGEERQPDVTEPALRLAQGAHAAALFDRLGPQKDAVTDQRGVAPQDGRQEKVALIESVGIHRELCRVRKRGARKGESVRRTKVTMSQRRSPYHVGEVRLPALVVHGLGGVLGESQSGIVQEFGHSLEND